VKLLERNSGKKFAYQFGPAGYRPQPESIEKWTDWVTEACPEEASRQLGGSPTDLASLKERLAAIAWEKGDIDRGQKLYLARGCGQCHSAGSGLGPDLAGAAGRFSRDDLFIAITLPNRDVSPRYQTTLIETKAGKTYTGMIVYEAADGLMLRNAVNQSFRLETRDIESRRNLPTSMPTWKRSPREPRRWTRSMTRTSISNEAPPSAATISTANVFRINKVHEFILLMQKPA
jgi:putative heme-binding domain-containing protein